MKPTEPWQQALQVLIKLEHADKKLNEYLKAFEKKGNNYAACRAYSLNVVKHKYLLNYFLEKNLRKATKPFLKAFLRLVAGDLWQRHLENRLETMAPLINGWVERSKVVFSKSEVKFVNAVLRKLPSFFAEAQNLPLSIRYNMPNWLIERYQAFYGEANTQQYLEWNQTPARVYVRTLQPFEGLIPSQWPQFYCVKDTNIWPKVFKQVQQGRAYIQDPMTRIPIEQLELREGVRVLDLCAAPGGKTIQIAQILKQTGCIVSVDLSEHMKRFLENIRTYPQVHWLAKDILELTKSDFEGQKLPVVYDCVLIDVPCSNTGVIQRKPDVIHRLTPKDFSFLPELQLKLLTQASTFVKPQGLLVYSTCSIDPEENERLIASFLKKNPNFSLQKSQISLPWEVQHDGGASFCLRRE
ncbi:MAG: RsmB/NOP family class I SAM-dependent RNA methyltransferase [Opitutales bacterium]